MRLHNLGHLKKIDWPPERAAEIEAAKQVLRSAERLRAIGVRQVEKDECTSCRVVDDPVTPGGRW